ncbi:GNAT family N-acetyltransferase [Celerinatantimonas sp. YJH-8]|uniref:GNAT family N-acetyltransferase n=1 Tax=Celerinatantimonas sp. YJH-8 TaxID=3228714 RepID=UPI0038CAE376
MAIRTIQMTDWNEILRIQNDMYSDVAPETLSVLQSKWESAPNCCFVYEQNQQVSAYLISHLWRYEHPPKLHTALPEQCEGPILFLHDLAVSRRVSGQKIGSQLAQHCIQAAINQNCHEIRLVSVQDSFQFWEKMNFSHAPHTPVSADYGENAKMMYRKLEHSQG